MTAKMWRAEDEKGGGCCKSGVDRLAHPLRASAQGVSNSVAYSTKLHKVDMYYWTEIPTRAKTMAADERLKLAWELYFTGTGFDLGNQSSYSETPT